LNDLRLTTPDTPHSDVVFSMTFRDVTVSGVTQTIDRGTPRLLHRMRVSPGTASPPAHDVHMYASFPRTPPQKAFADFASLRLGSPGLGGLPRAALVDVLAWVLAAR
jgi:hypothetical protein